MLKMRNLVCDVFQEKMSEMEFIIVGIKLTLTGLPKDV